MAVFISQEHCGKIKVVAHAVQWPLWPVIKMKIERETPEEPHFDGLGHFYKNKRPHCECNCGNL